MGIARTIVNVIATIFILLMGGMTLFLPYEKFKKIFPNAPSKMAVKVLGAIATVCGIGGLVALLVMF
ncbi:MAG: hypothetical protein HDQ97_05205 [Lachnospiraceae bacterium]|nr:hypothetical protein [Lachnospiraceae bacterium]